MAMVDARDSFCGDGDMMTESCSKIGGSRGVDSAFGKWRVGGLVGGLRLAPCGKICNLPFLVVAHSNLKGNVR